MDSDTHTHTHTHGGFPQWFRGKESAYSAGDIGSILGLGRTPGEGNGNLLQYSCLGNPMVKEPGELQSMGLQSASYN